MPAAGCRLISATVSLASRNGENYQIKRTLERRLGAGRRAVLSITLRSAQVRRISWVRGVRPAWERGEWPPQITASGRPPFVFGSCVPLGLVPGIHVFSSLAPPKTRMGGGNPAPAAG